MRLRAGISAIVLLAAACGASPAAAPAPSNLAVVAHSAESVAKRPFLLGAFVGANVHDWGDLTSMGSDSISAIRNISADMASLGCNAVWVTGFAPWFAEEPLMGTWLDAGESTGLSVVLEGSGDPYVIPRYGADRAEEVLTAARETIAPAWRRIASTYGRHPALLAYCPVEEIGDNIELGENHTVRALAEVSRAVAEVDPVHPMTTIHIASWYNVAVEEAKLRGRGPGGLRILVFDLYLFSHPIPEWADMIDQNLQTSPDDFPKRYLEFLDRYVSLGRENGAQVWIMAQSYGSIWTRKINGTPVSRRSSRHPNEAEMSFQFWGAALAGAKGLFLFQYHSTPQPSEENRATLEEWEQGEGMRDLAGAPTESYRSFAALGAAVRPNLGLLGRLEPDGLIEEESMILARPFRDPSDGRAYVMIINRDLVAARSLPESLAARLRIAPGEALAPGGGRIVGP